WITSAFVCWQLWRDPQVKILVVSASKQRADDFSTFTQRLISEMPLLQHLMPTNDQRQSKVAFDVAPARASHSPSVKSLGITSMLTGSRADIIVADDVEAPNNSATADLREKLLKAVKEFEAILTPKPTSQIIYLGTPQTEESIYN
uniref:phage terminase large subunit n=2 Tax=Campylobacteraceae TaxID=72294 RepID=UPI0021C06548